MSRRWMRSRGALSLHDHMQLMFIAWRWMDHYETFVRTGRPLDVHTDLREGEWAVYQRGMQAIARVSAPEVAARTPVPRGATAMLDVGGAHGFYSVAICRRHQRLRSTILDLPEAVEASAPLLASLLSDSGTLSFSQVAGWQRQAGLEPSRPKRLFTLPGTGQQAARKTGV